MKIAFFAKGERGRGCLEAVAKDRRLVIVAMVTQPGDKEAVRFGAWARRAGVPVFSPRDPNEASFLKRLRALRPDVSVLAGYGPILREDALRASRMGTVNLHGGKLPEYRGSSPLNWAMMNGERRFTLSVIRAVKKVDGGEVLAEKSFPIGPKNTIRDLHATANRVFPGLLVRVMGGMKKGKMTGRRQNEKKAGYYPLRFPDDGLLLWDGVTAKQAHDRIRALTSPYPCAFTYFGRKKVKLLASEFTKSPFYGTPGRIYRVLKGKVLVCAKDRCLWITRAVFESGADALPRIARYDKFLTLADAAVELAKAGKI